MKHPAKRLTFLEGRSLFPRFSPDGLRIVFTARVNRRCDIYSMGADGGDLKRLTTEDGSFSSATFSPEGSQIAFLRSDAFHEEIHDIWIMESNGTDQRPLTTTHVEYAPNFSPDGHWITFASGRDRSLEIYRMRADGSESRRLTFIDDDPEHRIGPPPKNLSPRYLPGGTGIVFRATLLRSSIKPENHGKVSVRASEVHCVVEDGSGRRRLSDSTNTCGDPEVSLSRNWIAFVQGESLANEQSLCVVRPDGSGLKEFAGSQGYYHSFHPAGDRVVFTSFRDQKVEKVTRNYDLYCVRIADGILERLTDNTAVDTLPVFSPDGKQIVFCSDRDGPMEIYSLAYEN